MKSCKLCDGTGFVYLLKSWFPSDGYSKSKCGICSGTGKSNYLPSPDYVQQSHRHASAARAAGAAP